MEEGIEGIEGGTRRFMLGRRMLVDMVIGGVGVIGVMLVDIARGGVLMFSVEEGKGDGVNGHYYYHA